MPIPYEVLYVDDSDAMQKTVSMIFLNNSEFKITPLYDGSSMIAILNNSLPSIIIINYNISNASSYKIIKEIKNDSLYSNIPVLLAAPSDLPNKERELFVEAGLTGFIYRPFDKETFINKIKRSLDLNINEEKIYDIAEFEKKAEKIENDTNQNIQNISSEQSENISDNTTENIVKTDNIQSNSRQEQDSAELSEAFENLFKDDNIFKEFQKLDKENVQTGAHKNIADGNEHEKVTDAAVVPINGTEVKSDVDDVAPVKTDVADNALNISQSAMSENTNNNRTMESKSISTAISDSAAHGSAAEEISISEVIPNEFESIRNIKTGRIDNDEEQEILNAGEQTNSAHDAADAAAKPESFNNNGNDDNDNSNENKINEYMSKIIINEDIGNSDNIRSLNFTVYNNEKNVNEENITAEQNNYEAPAGQNYLNLVEVTGLKDIDDTQISLYNINDENNNAVRKGGNVKLEFINDEIIGKIDGYIKKSIDDIINNMQPEIIENIKNILPEIAEKLIKEEIDKIKNENI